MFVVFKCLWFGSLSLLGSLSLSDDCSNNIIIYTVTGSICELMYHRRRVVNQILLKYSILLHLLQAHSKYFLFIQL